MKNNPTVTSPQVYARVAGIAYLVIIVTGAFGEIFIRNKMMVSGDAAATMKNILADPLRWRIGIAGDLLMHICDVLVMASFYVLMKPVNRNLVLFGIIFTIIQTSALVANKMTMVMPLLLPENGEMMKAFTQQQLEAWSYLSIGAHSYGFAIGLIYFGCECLISGYLIAISGFFPAILGRGLQLAGVCYLVNSFTLILAPLMADIIFPLILVPPFFAESAVCLWLIIKGVDVPRWQERAGTAGVLA